jgi:hypothetical protein
MSGITSVTFTSYAVISGTITVTADVVVPRISYADMSLFSYALQGGLVAYDPAIPTTQDPASGTQNTNFTLTLTFSETSFPALYVPSQTNNYKIKYDGTEYASQNYQYQASYSFSFTSFTVSQINLTSFLSYAEFAYAGLIPEYPVANNFTYTALVGGIPYSYTNGTPSNFTPTIGISSFSFIFPDSSNFSPLFVLSTQTHTLNFTNTQQLNVNSLPVSYTYSDTYTFTFTSFTVALDTSNSTIVRASFSYTYTGFTPSSANFHYYLNNDSVDIASYITWNFSQSGGSGTGTAEFTRVNQVTTPIFIQASVITHAINYSQFGIDVNTSTVNTVFTLTNSNNIQVTKQVTIITIDNYKSVILPPAETSKGLLFHFKILNVTAPYTFRVNSYLKNNFLPLQTYLYTTAISNPFASKIEDTFASSVVSSSLTTLTLVSDGGNWWILNKYLGTLTPNTAPILPSPAITESTETASFNYNYVTLANRNNIVLHSMSSSYLKYIFITNAYESSVTFSIYFPSGAGLETLSTNDGDIYKYFSFPLPSGAVGGVILTYSNSRYYIIGTSVNASITPAYVSLETPLIISSSISRLTTGTYFELPYLSNITSSNAVLTIIKAGTGTKQVNASQNVLFQIAQQANSAFELVTNSVVWFIVIKNGYNQYYLPIAFYSGS